MWQPSSATITKIILECLNKCKRQILLAIQQQHHIGSSDCVSSVSLTHRQICICCVIHRNYKSFNYKVNVNMIFNVNKIKVVCFPKDTG